jgi:hypothetical protein
MITVSKALGVTLRGKGLNDIDPHYQPREHCAPEEVEGDTSHLTSSGEYTSNTL